MKTLDTIVTLSDGTAVVCRFNDNGNASLRLLGFWVEVHGPFDPGDTVAVVEAYDDLVKNVREVLFRDEPVVGIETGVEFVDPEEFYNGLSESWQEGRVKTETRKYLSADGIEVVEIKADIEVDL